MKVNGKQIFGDTFAYDGCHKIYICECQCDEEEAVECGYKVFPIEVLEEAFENSCPLRFISNWALDTHYVVQWEDAIFEGV